MVENGVPTHALPYEMTGTEFKDNDQLDFHVGSDTLSNLEVARNAAQEASAARHEQGSTEQDIIRRLGDNLWEMRRQALPGVDLSSKGVQS